MQPSKRLDMLWRYILISINILGIEFPSFLPKIHLLYCLCCKIQQAIKECTSPDTTLRCVLTHSVYFSRTVYFKHTAQNVTIVQNIVFPSSAPLLMRCCTFFILNIFYFLIIMPSQAILELSHFLWA